MIGPRRYLRELLPLLENRPPTRSARLARKSQRLCLQAPSSPGRAGDIRSQSACRDVSQDSTIGPLCQAGGGAGSLVSRKGPIARYEHSGAQSSTSAGSGCSVPNALVRTKSRQPPGVAEAEFWRLVGQAEPRQRPQVASATASAAKSRGPGPYPRRRKRVLVGYLVALSGELHPVRGRCGPNSLWTGEALR